MKKATIFTLIAMLLVSSAIYAMPVKVSAESIYSVYLDGKKISFDNGPLVKNNTFYVQAVPYFKAYGATVTFAEKTKTLSAVKVTKDISFSLSMTADNQTIVLNGREVKMTSLPIIIDGILFTPIHKTTCDALGVTYEWSKTISNRLNITTAAKTAATSSPRPAATANPSPAASDDEWIYGSNFKDGIYKVKTDGTGFTVIYDHRKRKECAPDILDIVGDWIYFQYLVADEGNPSLRPGYFHIIDFRLCRIKKDGTNRQLLADMVGSCAIENGWIYYNKFTCKYNKRNEPLYNALHMTYRMKLDGTGKTLIDDKNSCIIVFSDDEWLYYYTLSGERDAKSAQLFKMKFDGTEKQVAYQPAFYGEVVDYLAIADGFIYFTGINSLYKLKTDGTVKTVVFNINNRRSFNIFEIKDGWIYYVIDSVKLGKIKTDGTSQTLFDLDTVEKNFYLSDMKIVGDWLYITGMVGGPRFPNDINDITRRSIYRIKSDGTGLRSVFSISDIYPN